MFSHRYIDKNCDFAAVESLELSSSTSPEDIESAVDGDKPRATAAQPARSQAELIAKINQGEAETLAALEAAAAPQQVAQETGRAASSTVDAVEQSVVVEQQQNHEEDDEPVVVEMVDDEEVVERAKTPISFVVNEHVDSGEDSPPIEFVDDDDDDSAAAAQEQVAVEVSLDEHVSANEILEIVDDSGDAEEPTVVVVEEAHPNDASGAAPVVEIFDGED